MIVLKACNEVRKKAIDFYGSLPIKRKMSLSFSIISLLLLFLLAAISNKLSADTIINKTIENTIQNLNLVIEKFDMLKDSTESYSKVALLSRDIQQTLESTRGRYAVYEDTVKVKAALSTVIEPKTNIESMIIYQLNRNIFDSGNIANVRFSNEQYNMLSAMHSAGIKKSWSEAHRSNYQKNGKLQNVISFYSIINNGDTGEFLGIIECCINENYLSGLYSKIRIGDTGKIFVLNTKGNIVSSTEKGMLYENLNNLPYFDWIMGHEDNGRIFTFQDVDYLVINKHYEKLNWIIVGVVPINEITKDSEDLTKRIFLIGFVSVALSVLLSELLAYSITKPVIKLMETVKSVGQGDFEARAEVGVRDEVGVLADEFNKMVKRASLLMDNLVEEQRSKREYELAMLQAQINPHFLYNTLESICGLAKLDRKEDVVDTINYLSTFYRGVLSKGSSLISIREEISITENYLKIMKMRYGEMLEYRMEISPELLDCFIIKLCLQPLVENSIYHGLRNKRGRGFIDINGYREDDYIFLRVRDNGIGMETEKLNAVFAKDIRNHKARSFGLKSTDERIKLYFGSDYGLTIDSTYGAGTTVNVKLPLKKDGV